MIPVVSIPNFQPVVNTTPSAVIYNTGQTSIGNIPVQSVPATIAVSEAQNQSRGNGQGKGSGSSSSAQQGLSNPLAILSTSTALTPQEPSSSVSSVFLAQLFGQSETQDSGLMSSYLGSFPPGGMSPTISADTMIAYSRVKYKPSNASLPEPPSPAEQIAAAPKASRPSNAEIREMIQQALRNQPAETQATIQRLQNGTTTSASSGFAATLSAAPPVRYTPPKPASGNPPSLIRTMHGASSYTATNTRNNVNLAQSSSKSEVTL